MEKRQWADPMLQCAAVITQYLFIKEPPQMC